MSFLANTLNALASNILPQGNNSGARPNPAASPRNSAIELTKINPLSAMDYDKFGFSHVSYPSSDLTDYMENGHYMLFYINVSDYTKYSYTGPGGVKVGGKYFRQYKKEAGVPGKHGVEDHDSEMMMSGGTEKPSYAKTLGDKGIGTNYDGGETYDLSKDIRGAKTGMSSWRQTTKRITDSIALYLPPNVQDSYTVGYNAHSTGMLGFLAATGFGIASAWNRNDIEEVAELLAGGTLGFAEYAVKKAALAAAEFAANAEGGEEGFNKFFGKADNPYMEVLFDKPQMRKFTYNFTFVPRNERERDDVQRIIQMFRFHMAPELRSDHNRFMTLPSEFDIHYMYQHEKGKASENDYYNRIATCVLEDCKVNYTPDDKVSSHADGSPVKTTMSLTFAETEMITKERINEGY
tara:strand:- start:101 stop:1321 length:1221 start_codon:yes stop_codon:yes gene_type:complete